MVQFPFLFFKFSLFGFRLCSLTFSFSFSLFCFGFYDLTVLCLIWIVIVFLSILSLPPSMVRWARMFIAKLEADINVYSRPQFTFRLIHRTKASWNIPTWSGAISGAGNWTGHVFAFQKSSCRFPHPRAWSDHKSSSYRFLTQQKVWNPQLCWLPKSWGIVKISIWLRIRLFAFPQSLFSHSSGHETCFTIQTAAKGKDTDQDQKLLNIPFKW